MREIILFVEDMAHEVFLQSLIRERLLPEFGLEAVLRPRSATGGFGRVGAELERYIQEIRRYHEKLPDLILVATDSNCHGFDERRDSLRSAVELVKDRVAFAIPDPHVERWLLLDPHAFKRVVGGPCKLPDQKCDKGRYKRLLADAVREAGATPLLGGLEYTEDLVREMDLKQAGIRDQSLHGLIADLRGRFRHWMGA
jgi:hypothetical protein